MNPSTEHSNGESVARTGEQPPRRAQRSLASALDLPLAHGVTVREPLSAELVESIEALQIAEEELRQQNVALMEAHEALAAEQVQYRTLFENAPHPYLVTDAYGTVRMANAAAVALLGAPAAVLAGKPLASFITLEARPAFRERLNALVAAADVIPPLELELELRSRQDDGVRTRITVARMRSRIDDVVTLLWMVHDRPATLDRSTPAVPTAPVEDDTTRDLRRANAELRAANREALTMLQREQRLRRALERAEGAKAHFFAALSHELRTPLQAIFGYTELLELELASSGTPTQRDFLRRMEYSERHLLGLVNNVLHLERLTRGAAVHPDVGPIPVAEVLDSVSDMALVQMGDRGLTIEVERPDAALTATGDRSMVQQVLLNLLTNALKFTPPGGAVRLGARALPDGMIAIDVSDTGRGIAQRDLRRIFDPFVQVAAGDARTGAGLGLAISRNLARALGGELTAQSEPGRGSRFTLTLPSASPGGPTPA